jgi:hypothetical protein
MDIIQVVWECFNYGFYTHSEAVTLLNTPEVFTLIPIADTPLHELCSDLLLITR